MVSEKAFGERDKLVCVKPREQIRLLRDFFAHKAIETVTITSHLAELQNLSDLVEHQAAADFDDTTTQVSVTQATLAAITEALAHCTVMQLEVTADAILAKGTVVIPFTILTENNLDEMQSFRGSTGGIVRNGAMTLRAARTGSHLTLDTSFSHEEWVENASAYEPIRIDNETIVTDLDAGIIDVQTIAEFYRELAQAREKLGSMVYCYNRLAYENTMVSHAVKELHVLMLRFGITDDTSISESRRIIKAAGIAEYDIQTLWYQLKSVFEKANKDTIGEILLRAEGNIIADDERKWRWHRVIENYART